MQRCRRIVQLRKMVDSHACCFISDADAATTKEAEYMSYFSVHFQCVDCLSSHWTKLCSNGRTSDTRCASSVLKTQGSSRQKRFALTQRF